MGLAGGKGREIAHDNEHQPEGQPAAFVGEGEVAQGVENDSEQKSAQELESRPRCHEGVICLAHQVRDNRVGVLDAVIQENEGEQADEEWECLAHLHPGLSVWAGCNDPTNPAGS
jgi:hypothetical protein